MGRPLFFRPPICDPKFFDRPWICIYFLAGGYAYPGFCESCHCLSIGRDGRRASALAYTSHGIGSGGFPSIYDLPFGIDNCIPAEIVVAGWSTFAGVACHAGHGTKGINAAARALSRFYFRNPDLAVSEFYEFRIHQFAPKTSRFHPGLGARINLGAGIFCACALFGILFSER